MSAINGKKIAIVGGGPGGLTLSRLLQQCGAQVSLYERDQSRSARVQGSALDLHEDSGLAALESAGLIDAFWANHRRTLIAFVSSMPGERFFTIMPAGCPVPGNVLRLNADRCGIFCWTRFNLALCNGAASSSLRRRRASRCCYASRAAEPPWPI